ncbi:dihydropteroate synthase [Moraxellaceae bacterium AER2_44_116]|nr:dihydropteroate synthase [Moraxellaceae bacterium]TQC98528.1 dihydropteroate synthase [Moraxellaceae bacterium AER2_44_116]
MLASSMSAMLRCGDKLLDLSSPVIMGVLNVTPDSFSDGGRYLHVDAALRQAELMLREGAVIIDIGAESTRPNANFVSEQQELDRLLPVIERIKQQLDVIISIDTSTPAVITEAAHRGAGIINDVRALQRDGALMAAAATGLPICLMHMQGQPNTMQQQPHYVSVVDEVKVFLQQRIDACLAVGICREQLLLDVGFGFGKTLSHNLELLRRLTEFEAFNLPLLVGMSRKSMLGTILGGAAVDERLYAGIAAATIAVMNGANIVRTHDVRATKDAIAVVSAMKF